MPGSPFFDPLGAEHAQKALRGPQQLPSSQQHKQETSSAKAKEAEAYRASFETGSTLPPYSAKEYDAAQSSSSKERSSQSKVSSAFSRLKSKVGGKGKDDGEEAAKAERERQRKEDYERLDLDQKVNFGHGGMQMNG